MKHSQATKRSIQILNTLFEVDAVDEGLLVILDAFEDAYGDDAHPATVMKKWRIRAEFQETDARVGIVRPVHRSKHPHWSFDSVEVGPGAYHWPSRGIVVRFGGDAVVDVAVSRHTSMAVGSEALYHVMRSIALYERAPDLMLHASSVRLPSGHMVAFSGRQGSGKTTMVLNLLKAFPEVVPMTNDRLVLRAREGSDKVEGQSWPSYFSLCEGTILDFPEIAEYAKSYEAGLPVTTTRWGTRLERSYVKSQKRVYPMGTLSDLYARRYARTGDGLTLVFPELELDSSGKLDISEIDPAELSAAIEGNVFSGDDDSFLPWHGLPSVVGPDPTVVLSGSRALRLRASVDRIAAIPRALTSVLI